MTNCLSTTLNFIQFGETRYTLSAQHQTVTYSFTSQDISLRTKTEQKLYCLFLGLFVFLHS